MKKIIIILSCLFLLISCEGIIENNISSNNSSNSKDNRTQSMSNDEIIADSILTQIIGYVTQNFDTVRVVNYYDIHITGGKKYIVVNCVTDNSAEGHTVGIQYHDSTAVGYSSTTTYISSCVAVNGCENACGSCGWSQGEYPVRSCKCDAGFSSTGDCGISSSQLSLIAFGAVGHMIRQNTVICDLNTYEY